MEPSKSIPAADTSGSRPAANTVYSSANASDFSHLPRGLLGKKGLPVGRGKRLPSIRSPRDLTLGGAPKRTFTPNIPVRRDRSKDGDSKMQLSDGHRRDRGSPRGMRGRGGERGRGRGRGHSDLIQTQGAVFGEGLANATMKRGSYGDYSRDDTKSQMTVPKYTSAPLKTKKEREEEEMKLKDLLRDDFVDDDEDEMEGKMHPVILPMTKGTKIKGENYMDSTVKPEIKVKVEKTEAHKLDDVKVKLETKKEEKQEAMDEEETETEEISPKDLFREANVPESGKLLFFQFPSCLPGSLRQDEDVKPNMRKESPVSPVKGQAAGNQDNSNTCKLADLPEGYIGKLQVLKSGKTRFMIGPIVYNIEMGTPVGFLQDLVSVRVSQDSGEMTVLGHVQDKLVCVPDMESLLAACL